MNRREFIGAVGATLGAAATPVAGMIKAPAARAAAVSVRTPQMMYGWAVVYAQMNEGVSPAKLAQAFRMSPHDAQIVYDRMLERGVLMPPNLDGIAKAKKPWRPWEKRAADARRAELRAAFQNVMSPVLGHPSFGWTGVATA